MNCVFFSFTNQAIYFALSFAIRDGFMERGLTTPLVPVY